jgi:hypothetical protein
LGGGVIFIGYDEDLRVGFGSTEFTTAFYKLFKDSINYDYSKEYRVIEQPSFLTVDGQKIGTFLFTSKDKYEDYASTWGTQDWFVFVGTHGYLITFFATTDTFDSPENIAIRDKFINSIKFLGLVIPQQSIRLPDLTNTSSNTTLIKAGKDSFFYD